MSHEDYTNIRNFINDPVAMSAALSEKDGVQYDKLSLERLLQLKASHLPDQETLKNILVKLELKEWIVAFQFTWRQQEQYSGIVPRHWPDAYQKIIRKKFQSVFWKILAETAKNARSSKKTASSKPLKEEIMQAMAKFKF